MNPISQMFRVGFSNSRSRLVGGNWNRSRNSHAAGGPRTAGEKKRRPLTDDIQVKHVLPGISTTICSTRWALDKRLFQQIPCADWGRQPPWKRCQSEQQKLPWHSRAIFWCQYFRSAVNRGVSKACLVHLPSYLVQLGCFIENECSTIDMQAVHDYERDYRSG